MSEKEKIVLKEAKFAEYFYEGMFIKIAPCHRKAKWYKPDVFEVTKTMMDEVDGTEIISVKSKISSIRKQYSTQKVAFIEIEEEDLVSEIKISNVIKKEMEHEHQSVTRYIKDDTKISNF